MERRSEKNEDNNLSHQGKLSLRFQKQRGKTKLVDCYEHPPLKVSRIFYEDLNATATAYVMETSGGLVAGDRNEYDIVVEDGAKVCLIQQAATKIYPSVLDRESSQIIHISLEKSASLLWKPESLIPFRGSRYSGETVIRMQADSNLLWGEILSPGREKHGERFAFDSMQLLFQVWINEQCLVYDALNFTSEELAVPRIGLLEDYGYIGSLWLISTLAQGLDESVLNEKLAQFDAGMAGITRIAENAVHIRWLTSDLVLLKENMTNIWLCLKEEIEHFDKSFSTYIQL